MDSHINGRYQLQNKLGAGGMGVVHLALDHLTGEAVALKQITLPTEHLRFTTRPINLIETDLKLALAHEFQTIASLRHPHIISVLDYGFDDAGYPFFTMPYLAEAKTFLEAGWELDEKGKLTLLLQLVQALMYLHRRNILHRDLKPSNILVNKMGLKVLDFGLSGSNDETNNASGGTPSYLAPEVWEQNIYSSASDMFAVGVLAFQLFAEGLLTSHPFGVLDDGLFLDRLLEQEPNWSALQGQTAITQFIGQLLEKNPQKRLEAPDALRELSTLLGQEPPETSDIRDSYLQAAAFVGREAEMSQLNTHLKHAKTGQAQGVLIGGESGVGKSRLINEIRIQALINGFLVLRGQGILEGGLPYQLWRNPIRRLCLMTPLTPLAASVLHPLVPDLPALMGQEIEPAPELDGRQAQQRLFSVIIELFRRQTRPILLMLEDLQWVEESLDVLAWLLRNMEGMRLLVVGTYRMDERPLLPNMFPQIHHIALQRLADTDVQTLCGHMLGHATITGELVTFLQQQSEGNTFFLVEVVRSLAEQAGRLAHVGQMPLPETVFPAGIASILEQRLTLLPESAKPLLQVAAVAGRQINHALMQQIAGQEVKEWLSAVTDVGLLSVEGEQWQFAHDKLREGLLNQLNTTTTQALHTQVAIALETIHPNDPGHAADLMWHWGKANKPEKECLYAQQAGAYAQSQNAYQEALLCWGRAEELLAQAEPSQQYPVYLAQEAIYARQGNREAQQTKLTQLQQVVQTLDLPAQGEVALRQAEYANITSHYEQAIHHAQEVIALGQQSDNKVLVVAGHQKLGASLENIGAHDSANTHYQTGLQLAKNQNMPQQIADCLKGLGSLNWRQGNYATAQEYCKQALLLYQEMEDQVGEAKTLNNFGLIASMQGDYERGNQYYQQVLHIYQKIGDRYGEGLILCNVGVSALSQMKFDVAQAYSQQALAIVREIGDRSGQARILNNLGSIAIEQGDYTTARQYLQKSLIYLQEIGDKHLESLVLNNLALGLIEQQKYEQVAPYLEQALAISRTIGDQFIQGLALYNLGRFLDEQENLASANTAYQQAQAIHQKLNMPHYLVDDWAGLAHVNLKQNHKDVALHYAIQVFLYIQENSHMPPAEIARTAYLTWRVLKTLGQLKEADTILSLAIQTLQEYLENNQDRKARAMYLNRPYHRILWDLWQKKTNS